jgi:hypothetical protein
MIIHLGWAKLTQFLELYELVLGGLLTIYYINNLHFRYILRYIATFFCFFNLKIYLLQHEKPQYNHNWNRLLYT